MRTVCKGGEIDFDVLNKFDPDGHGPFCAVSVDGYGTDVPAVEKGTFLVTSDNGRIRCADLAFKLVLDIGLRSGDPGLGYLSREVERSCRMYSEGERQLAKVGDASPLKTYLEELGVHKAMLPDTTLCVACNLNALREHDMTAWMASQRPGTRANSTIRYLNTYLWLGKSARTFSGLCESITGLMTAMSTDDVRVFLEGLYSALESEAQERPPVPEVEEEHDNDPDPDTGVGAGDGDGSGEDGSGAEAEPGQAPVQAEIPSAPQGPTDSVVEAFMRGNIRVKGISSSDITGLDETYALNYLEEGYLRELNMKDSEGLFEGVLKARINGTPAPVDVLSEVVEKQASGHGEAAQLKSKLADIAEEIQERTGE